MTDKNRKVSFFSIATRSRLSGVEILAKSLQYHCPAAVLYVYVVERSIEIANLNELPDNCVRIGIEEIDITDLGRMTFQYDAMALCCALKPRVACDLLDRGGSDVVVYLDNDMRVYNDVSSLVEELQVDREASVWLTPHFKSCHSSLRFDAILRSGAFNAGYFMVRNDEKGREFLGWWSNCTATECIEDPMHGILYDQKWLDLAQACFEYVRPIRHAGMNVGHWDLHEKAFIENNKSIFVRPNCPLMIYHFSGADRERISRHLTTEGNKIKGESIVKDLVCSYLDDLERSTKKFPTDCRYSYGYFNSGDEISIEMREVVRLGLYATPNPFSSQRIIEKLAQENGVAIAASNTTRASLSGIEATRLLVRLDNHWLIGFVWRSVVRFLNKALDPNKIIGR